MYCITFSWYKHAYMVIQIVELWFKPFHSQNRISIWAATWQNQQNDCASSEESDQPVHSLCAQWIAKDQRFLNADSEDAEQTGRMPRLIWVFAGRTAILLVLSCRGSFVEQIRHASLYFILSALKWEIVASCNVSSQRLFTLIQVEILT